MYVAELQHWLDALPKGLDSFPSCRCKGSLIETLMSATPFPEHARADLPYALQGYFDEPPLVSRWYPEAHLVGLMLGYYDVVYRGSADAFVHSFLEMSRLLFSKPMYRILLRVGAPRHIVVIASKTWGLFHQGSSLRVIARTETSARLRLDIPRLLYPDAIVPTVAQAFIAAVELSGGHAVRADYERTEDRVVDVSLRWS